MRTLFGSGPARNRRRQEALRRHGAAAVSVALAATALGATAAAKPPNPHHPKPKPKLELLTGTEQGALRREEIKVGVTSRRGEEARVVARFVVDGYPDDFVFRLGPESTKLRENDGVAHLGLSQRQLEVLDFAIKSCHGATLAITAEVGKGTGHLNASLAMPADCRGA
jgi:hypothetical protein